MRFQISEMVDSPDADLVSRALETSLRAQWGEVAREGNIIVLRGLGPTHRVNRNDKAVFEVKPAESGRTAIDADVTYQASALVGTTAPQNELVQRKLDGVLELVRMDVDLAQRRAAQEGERGQKPWLVNKNAAMTSAVAEAEPEAVRVDSPAVEREPAAVRQTYAWEEVPPKLNNGAASHETEKVSSTVVKAVTSPAAAASIARKVEAVSAATVVPDAAAARPQMVASEQKLVHRGEDLANEERDHLKRVSDRSIGKLFAMLLVVFVLAGAAQMGWQYRAQLGQQASHWRAGWSGIPGSEADAGPTPEQRAAEEQAAREAAAADAEKAVEAAKLAEPDPKKWLENWADALRGQDAGTQAAFYADTVDKYFLKKDVSRADVMVARQASLEKRTGSWTLRLDNVVVAEQTDTTARILLVKYIATNGPAGAVEERLPTQIKLKRIEGQWRIVSEQTLG